LYECDTLLIPVSKEINLIKDYIYLEKLRYSNININLSAQENLDDVYIIPLVLFPFIENAFKHGTSKTTKNKWININLFIENNRLHFNVKNSKKDNFVKSNTTKFYNHSKGIGINNATKRLQLFYGKNNFNLDIYNNNTFFEIDLRINLSTNVDKAIV
jgi:LytS/YehU family sensor histidine kinase